MIVFLVFTGVMLTTMTIVGVIAEKIGMPWLDKQMARILEDGLDDADSEMRRKL